MEKLLPEIPDRGIRQLEARVAHRQSLAAQLARHGFRGAASRALALVETLEGRLGRDRDHLAVARQDSGPTIAS
jgi:hypothetical protein